MKNKRIILLVVGIIIAMIAGGCVVEKPIIEDPPIDGVGLEDEAEEPVKEDVVNPDDEKKGFSSEEIKEMYGEDEMLYSVAKEFIGSEMPNVELVDKDGQSVMLYDLYSDGPYILEVMGTWCPVCEKTLPHAEEFNKRNDVPFILISSDESIEEVAAFVGDYDVPFYVAKDPIAFNDALYVPFVPASMFVDSDGIIQMIGAGEIDVEFIEYIAGRSF